MQLNGIIWVFRDYYRALNNSKQPKTTSGNVVEFDVRDDA